MNIRTTTAFATGAIFALVLGTGTAYAANGGNFKLGGNNYESREASLNNSGGTALTLRSQAGHAVPEGEPDDQGAQPERGPCGQPRRLESRPQDGVSEQSSAPAS